MNKLKNTLRPVINILAIIAEIKRHLLWQVALKSLLKAIHPFIMIIITSQAVIMLSAGDRVTQILLFSAVGIIMAFVVWSAVAVLEKICSVSFSDCWRRFEGRTSEKTLSLDYPRLESPETSTIRENIQNNKYWGAGIDRVYGAFVAFTECTFTLVSALAVTVPLFSSLAGRSTAPIVLAICIVLTGLIVLSISVNRAAAQKERDTMNELSVVNNLMSYFCFGLEYSAGKDIRIYSAQELIEETVIRQVHEPAVSFFKKVTGISGFAAGTSAAVSMLVQGGSYIVVGAAAAAGMISIGMMIRYAGSIYQFFTAITSLLDRITALVINSERLESTVEYFKIPDMLQKGTLTTEKRSDNEYEIEFHNVSFKYPGSDVYVLRNLSLKFGVGQRLAVVGMNGSGKSTMIKLLCRLYDPTEGEITLNRINIKKYEYEEYLQLFSVVFQDFKLFSLPLGQNVASSAEPDSVLVRESLKKAGFGTRLEEMPLGIETYLYKDFSPDGVEISGGEAQKIALARALYKAAPFIILDEPTAALDPIAEYEVYSGFNSIVGDKTAIFISHRLSSCRFCDNIAVFHAGQLVQRGSHNELVEIEHGKYYELWHAQAQYYT